MAKPKHMKKFVAMPRVSNGGVRRLVLAVGCIAACFFLRTPRKTDKFESTPCNLISSRNNEHCTCGAENELSALRRQVHAGVNGDLHVMRQAILAQQAATSLPNETPTRGVVVPAGGVLYSGNAFVHLHWGSVEKDAITPEMAAMFKQHIQALEIIDLSKIPYPKHQRWLFPPDMAEQFNGWKVKIFAAYAAPFDEVLMLDGDTMLLANPEALFDHPAYKEHGGMFWPDAWCRRIHLSSELGLPDPWKQTGGQPRFQGETGQFMLDRRRHNDVLEWLLFLNTHDEFTYYHTYGDKDTFLPAFMLANKGNDYFQGESLVRVQGLLQHHPDSSFLFLHRAGASERKYHLNTDSDERKNLSHIMIQPGCEWNQRNFFTSASIPVREWDHPIIKLGSCSYLLHDVDRSLEACGLEEIKSELQTGHCTRPPIFEVGPDMVLQQLQQAADSAFALLKAAMPATVR